MRRIAMLPFPVLVMACTSDAQHQAPQNAAGTTSLVLIREADFEQSDTRMLVCPGAFVGAQHQDLQVNIDILTTGGGTTSASRKADKTDVLLQIVVTKTDPASSHVALHAVGNNARLNDDVWQIIQDCVKS